MHGLVSLLPDQFYKRVVGLWSVLEVEFGLKGIQVTRFPHFSWQIGEDYPFQELKKGLDEITKMITPFMVRTTGLGLFTGETPVIYIPVVKTINLMGVHEKIWERFQTVGSGISEFYNPENWMPHISLAYHDVDKNTIGEVMRFLAFERYDWEMKVDNISFIFELDGDFGELKYKLSFTG
ncbi:MAG: 2'-5' RNA ligase family protein [Anaerolineaceae bacterium]|nr:2'-5' RNA ligase family protein [Anaerolineaceae bacterium]